MVFENLSFNDLKKKGWTLIGHRQPLSGLKGKQVDSHQLVILLGPENRFGASYFAVFLQGRSGDVSQQPIAIALHNQGRYPGYNWIEVAKMPLRIKLGSGEEKLSMSPDGLVHQLFQHLAELIPPGGHMMVEYDSPLHQDTARSLALGIPAVVTPLGYLLFLVGCGAGFKDWHFAEGGSEGPRKLQGYKALNNQHARQSIKKTIEQVEAFLAAPSLNQETELARSVRQRASALLSKLKGNSKGGLNTTS